MKKKYFGSKYFGKGTTTNQFWYFSSNKNAVVGVPSSGFSSGLDPPPILLPFLVQLESHSILRAGSVVRAAIDIQCSYSPT